MISKKVFIATDGFIAFIDRAHPKHLHATAQFRYFAQNTFQVYTSLIVLNEVYNELYNTISPAVARDFMRAIELSNLNILYPEDSDFKKSLRIVATSQIVDLTFNKSVTAILCNKRSIPQICTFE
jgi:predicted nucleic acid-binding protein